MQTNSAQASFKIDVETSSLKENTDISFIAVAKNKDFNTEFEFILHIKPVLA